MTKYDPMTAYSEEVIGYSVNTDVHPTAYSEDDNSTSFSLNYYFVCIQQAY